MNVFTHSLSPQTVMRRNRLNHLPKKKAVSREKAQKKESFPLTETFTEWVTTVSIPSFSFCAFCAFSWPSTAVFRFTARHVGFVFEPVGKDAQLIGGDSALLNALEQIVEQSRRKILAAELRHAVSRRRNRG
jgi:hypothetical protein